MSTPPPMDLMSDDALLEDSNAMLLSMRKRTSMTEDEQSKKRASIKEIMQDETLTALERRRSIQSLMDGRRQSAGATQDRMSIAGSMTMIASAAAAAADFYDSDDDSMQHNALTRHSYGFNASTHNDADEEDDDQTESSLSSAGADLQDRSVRSVRSQESSPMPSSRGGSFQNHPRAGRSASLKAFASSAAAAAAAVVAQFSDYPEGGNNMRMEKSRPECEHYERQCSIISPCCQLCFGCRICHDECPVLPPPFSDSENNCDADGADTARKKAKLAKRRSSQSDDQHHLIDRFAIKEVICRQCFSLQSSKTNSCIKCKIQFGEYHCIICNLWMSADEEPYHCMECGFCRVGGRDKFRHCQDCGMCIDALLFGDHNCKAGKYMSNCPVCQEDLFSSRSASHEMPCGHAIHWHCFRELTSFDTRCPVCKKTAETHDQMQPTWAAMAMGIVLQPVPPEMARAVTILCNDCEEIDEDRSWHFLGVQCLKCSSFNTTVEKTTLVGLDAANLLGDNLNAMTVNSSAAHLMFLEEGAGYINLEYLDAPLAEIAQSPTAETEDEGSSECTKMDL